MKYLESGVHCNDNGWTFRTSVNNDYPHAPWWTHNEEEAKKRPYSFINVTAEITGFVLRFAEKESPLYKKCVKFAENMISLLYSNDEVGETYGYCMLLHAINQCGLAERFDVGKISALLKENVNRTIERDIALWKNYRPRPSSFIQSPNSPYYKGNEDIVDTELDYLIDTKPNNGVWSITWNWGKNYPREFAIAENWWKAICAMGSLKLLRNFGRIESYEITWTK